MHIIKKISIAFFLIVFFVCQIKTANAQDIQGICLADIYKDSASITAHDIKVKGDRLYIAFHDSQFGKYSGGLDIFNITDPLNPVLIKRFNYTMPATAIGHGHKAMTIAENLVYIANWTGGLCVIDISDELNPYIMGTYTEGCGSAGTAMHEMIVDGDYLYVAWDNVYGLGILDISDPTDIKKITHYSGISYARGIAKKDNYVFVTTYYGSYIRVFNVSDVYNPRLVANIATPGYAWYIDIYIAGNLLYISDERDTYGLKIYDISDPENPAYIGKYATSGFGYRYIRDVAARGHYVYSTFDYGTALFDTTDPFHPVLLYKERISENISRRKLDINEEEKAFYITGINGDEILIMSIAYTRGELIWEGSKGYESDGVEIINGEYVFKVKYINTDNVPPITRQLWIDLNANSNYEEEEKYDMQEQDSMDTDYTDGKVYQITLNLDNVGASEINYKFAFKECAGDTGGVASEEQILGFISMVYPINSTIINDPNPTFKWQIPNEPDNNILHFKVEIMDESGILYTYESKEEPAGFTPLPPVVPGRATQFYTMLKNLKYNKTYYWRVSAWNGDKYYINSPVWEFIIEE